MTSIKTNSDNFLTNLKHEINPSSKFLAFNKSLPLLTKQNLELEHSTLIKGITLKNSALTKHDKKAQGSRHSHNLTFCQKYAQSLFHKYGAPESVTNVVSPKTLTRNQQNLQSRLLQDQETISKKLIIGKRYFQNVQFTFDKEYEDIYLRVRYLSKIFESKNLSFTEKDRQVEEDLTIMEMFVNKVNSKMSKSHNVTPFSMFVDDIKRKTPEKKPFHNKGSSIYFNSLLDHDHICEDSPSIPTYQNKQKKRSFIVTPQTPDLLHSFNGNYFPTQNSSSKDQNNLLISFNRQNLSNSGMMMGGDTLKYSECSDLNIDLNNKGEFFRENGGREVQYKEGSGGELPYSPVQPYRLHKLEAEKKEGKGAHQEKRKNHIEDTHKTLIKEDNEEVTFMDREDDTITSAANQIHTLAHQSFCRQSSLASKLTSSLSQSYSDLTQITQKTSSLFTQQAQLCRLQWEQIVDQLSKDIEEIQNLLLVERTQNDMKDKKFLENLEVIQGELIEGIFEEKECRKVEEGVLTQVLKGLVESLEGEGRWG